MGGRVWSIRGGDLIEQTGRPDQRAMFDPGLYFNAGAAKTQFYQRVKPLVRLQSPVDAIRRSGDGVRVEHGPGDLAKANTA